MVPRTGGERSSSTVIKLDTVRKIAEQVRTWVHENVPIVIDIQYFSSLVLNVPFFSFQDKHPLLDITPTAVERLNYIQYHPMVFFLDPPSRKDVKGMRQRYAPDSNKSSRRLYASALKTRKHYSHLFSGMASHVMRYEVNDEWWLTNDQILLFHLWNQTKRIRLPPQPASNCCLVHIDGMRSWKRK